MSRRLTATRGSAHSLPELLVSDRNVNEAKQRLGACLDRAGFVGVDDGVDAVADVELAQDLRDVRL